MLDHEVMKCLSKMTTITTRQHFTSRDLILTKWLKVMLGQNWLTKNKNKNRQSWTRAQQATKMFLQEFR